MSLFPPASGSGWLGPPGELNKDDCHHLRSKMVNLDERLTGKDMKDLEDLNFGFWQMRRGVSRRACDVQTDPWKLLFVPVPTLCSTDWISGYSLICIQNENNYSYIYTVFRLSFPAAWWCIDMKCRLLRTEHLLSDTCPWKENSQRLSSKRKLCQSDFIIFIPRLLITQKMSRSINM